MPLRLDAAFGSIRSQAVRKRRRGRMAPAAEAAFCRSLLHNHTFKVVMCSGLAKYDSASLSHLPLSYGLLRALRRLGASLSFREKALRVKLPLATNRRPACCKEEGLACNHGSTRHLPIVEIHFEYVCGKACGRQTRQQTLASSCLSSSCKKLSLCTHHYCAGSTEIRH